MQELEIITYSKLTEKDLSIKQKKFIAEHGVSQKELMRAVTNYTKATFEHKDKSVLDNGMFEKFIKHNNKVLNSVFNFDYATKQSFVKEWFEEDLKVGDVL